ncbi:hypothetical protein RJ639_009288, partial [Escallonia herrerae]
FFFTSNVFAPIYVSSYLGISSPLPYERRKSNGRALKGGMKFCLWRFGSLQHKVYYTEHDNPNRLLSSNDYATYLGNNSTLQIALNLKRISDLGVQKIDVMMNEPEVENTTSNFHNQMLKQAVQSLQHQSKEAAFVILDLYTIFTLILKGQGSHQGILCHFNDPLKPCREGVAEDYSRGSTSNGNKKYMARKKPQQSFF